MDQQDLTTLDRIANSEGPQSAEALRHIKMFRDLSADTLVQITSLIERRKIRARSVTNLGQDFKDRIGFVWTGRYRVIATSPANLPVTLLSLAPGDTFGQALAFHGAHAMTLRLIADQSGLVLHLQLGDLQAIAKYHPDLCKAQLETLAALSMSFAERVFELAALDVRTRLQAELLRLAKYALRGDDGRIIVAPSPTHAALGTQIGAAREAVTRQLRELADDGVIQFSRGVIEIIDLKRLQSMEAASSGRTWAAA